MTIAIKVENALTSTLAALPQPNRNDSRAIGGRLLGIRRRFLLGSLFVGAIASVPPTLAQAPAPSQEKTMTADREAARARLQAAFTPPTEFANQFGSYPSPLRFYNGEPVKTPADWPRRREEILKKWHALMGPWPALLKAPKLKIVAQTTRDNFTQYEVKVELARDKLETGYLLVPQGKGPFPAVVVPYYEPLTSIGLKVELRDFALQLARRGFVALAIGSPGGDALKREADWPKIQTLSFLAYIAANCHTILANHPAVDAKRIGIVGHSYGGKWAMFGSCLYDKFACGVWSDGGVVFDEKRGSINYWEPWYLGWDPRHPDRKKRGLITADNPAFGPYLEIRKHGHDLTELHALMAPRPFLVSGGSEDYPGRWVALNHAIRLNKFLGYSERVAMTNRPAHAPTPESNEVIYAFLEQVLQPPGRTEERR